MKMEMTEDEKYTHLTKMMLLDFSIKLVNSGISPKSSLLHLNTFIDKFVNEKLNTNQQEQKGTT